ncbi:GntR family transcriptional regulator [Variovorax sp. PAMC 28711]|uniref:GntR family transcriptional regulator n=1 Tax=Variovorax sp. PAMC 28711 TaxID=1795631 RepID=UPI00078BF5B1|nr:GntR family transcriptional regulator [Variovorax sp. PAMC 28711]AMM25762.1 GntR family transcriptional regulator [Variovorax sp. PAMC 28711]
MSTVASFAVHDAVDAGTSQAVKAQLRLREMVLAGELPGGTRIAEVAMSELLGVSRTPVRSALMRLEQEGLLESLPNGGYAVRTFSERDVSDSIELRGTLEGLAARLAAERGAPPVVLREARACLQRIDALLREPALDDTAFSRYVDFNARFHALLSELSGSPVIAQQLERITNLPFASPSGFVVVQANSPAARDMLLIAQDQHRQVLDAIESREGSRAEALMREHSRLAQRNLREALHGAQGHPLPGVQLIRRRS